MQSHLTPNHFWEFAALAHEIRQPLTAILSNAQAAWHFLAMDTPDPQERTPPWPILSWAPAGPTKDSATCRRF